MDCRQEIEEFPAVLTVFLKRMLEGEVSGFSLFVEPCGVGCQKGKRVFIVFVFDEMEKTPAYEMRIGAVALYEILGRSFVSLYRVGKGLLQPQPYIPKQF